MLLLKILFRKEEIMCFNKLFAATFVCFLLFFVSLSYGKAGWSIFLTCEAGATALLPTNVHSFQIEGAVKVAWDQVNDVSVTGINIYRSADGFSYAKISSITSPSSNSFEDFTIQRS